MAPRIVVTVADPSLQPDLDLARRKNDRYAESVRRHGGRPVLLDATTGPRERERAFETMDGLLLSGGADVHPSRYGQADLGSREIEPARDELEAAAWDAAEVRHLPVLGICRGFQAINIFSGGTLLQDVAGHAGPGWGTGPAAMHRIRIDPASRLASMLFPGVDDDRLGANVNTYHHQAVLPSDVAPSLLATAWADSPVGEIVEALERPGGRFIVGVQCHPERTEFGPPELERLWAAFIAACGRPAGPQVRARSSARSS